MASPSRSTEARACAARSLVEPLPGGGLRRGTRHRCPLVHGTPVSWSQTTEAVPSRTQRRRAETPSAGLRYLDLMSACCRGQWADMRSLSTGDITSLCTQDRISASRLVRAATLRGATQRPVIRRSRETPSSRDQLPITGGSSGPGSIAGARGVLAVGGSLRLGQAGRSAARRPERWDQVAARHRL